MDNKVDVLLGLQWGDEGKGKVVDVLTPHYDIVGRFQGGPNAGHTLEIEGKTHVLRSVPSGVFQSGSVNIIGNGVVLDPILFAKEAEELEEAGVVLHERLRIARKTHLILPTHRLLDAANEQAKGSTKIGTTGKGIGPTYTDKISRNGLRVGDIETPDFRAKYEAHRERHRRMLCDLLGHDPLKEASFAELEREFFDAIEKLRAYKLINCEYFVNDALREGKHVLAEGAQGSLLDIDYGSYPFVTSSTTIASGCCAGFGVAPSRIGRVFGIFKAYCTRVGEGPFPTELFDETGDEMSRVGHEYGAVTGRKRRCGWIDLVTLRYTTMLSGVTDLIMTKGDVLGGFDEIKVCTKYRVNGKETTEYPFDINAKIEPIYTTLPGWKCDLTGITRAEDLPEAFTSFMHFIEEELGAPISIVSVGPDRKQTIILREI